MNSNQLEEKTLEIGNNDGFKKAFDNKNKQDAKKKKVTECTSSCKPKKEVKKEKFNEIYLNCINFI